MVFRITAPPSLRLFKIKYRAKPREKQNGFALVIDI